MVATMRSDLLPASNLDSHEAPRHRPHARTHWSIDVLVNNAGIGLFGAVEATPVATVRELSRRIRSARSPCAKRSSCSCGSAERNYHQR